MKGEKVFNAIVEAFFIGMAITIPFWMLFNNIVVILGLSTSIIYFFKFKKDKRIWQSIYTAYIFLYALMIIALLYTANLKIGFQKLEQRLLFIVLPLICFSFTKYINSSLIKKILKWFVYSILVAVFIILIVATKKTLYFGSLNPFNEINGNFFSYIEFTNVLDEIHPIYFGTYVLFSIFILGNDYFENDEIIKLKPVLRLLCILLFTIISFLLNSFLLTALTLIVLVYFSILLIRLKKIHSIMKGIVVLLFLASMIFSSFFIYNKFKGLDLKNDLVNRDFSGTQFTAVKARMAKLYCSVDLILDNFWIGVAPGDEKEELLRCYHRNNFRHGVERNFNSHNQYLTEFIYTGVFGFIGLIVLFLIIFRRGLLEGNNYLIAIGIIFFVFSLTESALVRNKGIVFFVFFSCFLFHLKKEKSLSKP
ncbi:O-antigen ligase family protein [Flavivirga amylovorans]|uniref:O-antigen ligase family protein n=1 Tax=Flavivirga amylovorans TaxID=870486 RepID=A0ABT8X5K3_9FLAO|nr:O-antigen ligase family protein [Flavivirga amylovorans]MDO5989276.1 O-antigen ligase family protein [Flavivirga amylovorans]